MLPQPWLPRNPRTYLLFHGVLPLCHVCRVFDRFSMPSVLARPPLSILSCLNLTTFFQLAHLHNLPSKLDSIMWGFHSLMKNKAYRPVGEGEDPEKDEMLPGRANSNVDLEGSAARQRPFYRSPWLLHVVSLIIYSAVFLSTQ